VKFPDGAFTGVFSGGTAKRDVSAGIDEPVETMIVDHSYLVFVVERRDREVFVLLGYNFLTRLN